VIPPLKGIGPQGNSFLFAKGARRCEVPPPRVIFPRRYAANSGPPPPSFFFSLIKKEKFRPSLSSKTPFSMRQREPEGMRKAPPLFSPKKPPLRSQPRPAIFFSCKRAKLAGSSLLPFSPSHDATEVRVLSSLLSQKTQHSPFTLFLRVGAGLLMPLNTSLFGKNAQNDL